MILSQTFRKALDAVGPQDEYQKAIQWAMDNPDFDCGQTVAVYEYPEQRDFICYARIIRHKWSHPYETWIFTVRPMYGHDFDAPARQLRVAAPDECRDLWTSMRRVS